LVKPAAKIVIFIHFSDIVGITNLKTAEKLTIATDKMRTALIESFLGSKLDPGIFDVIYNCKTLPGKEIVNATLTIMQDLKMI
jgi:hypothetical protein